jgi:hypothetical protein
VILRTAVSKHLREDSFISYLDIADSLGAIPWDVLDVCRQLVRKGAAQEGGSKQRGTFRRKTR